MSGAEDAVRGKGSGSVHAGASGKTEDAAARSVGQAVSVRTVMPAKDGHPSLFGADLVDSGLQRVI
jgi:hypothetical protein